MRRNTPTVSPINTSSVNVEETTLKTEFVAEDVKEVDMPTKSNVVVPISRQLNLLQLVKIHVDGRLAIHYQLIFIFVVLILMKIVPIVPFMLN